MKLNSIKAHLSPYSIVLKRSTTINHAFASAIAPCDAYDESIVAEGIRFLGQDPAGDLRCVYCDGPAKTWDHLVGLVKAKQLSGYGHQLGNLVPSCAACNSQKGSKYWERFIDDAISDEGVREKKRVLLKAYLSRFAKLVDLKKAEALHPAEWQGYLDVKAKILELMTEADRLAAKIRQRVR